MVVAAVKEGALAADAEDDAVTVSEVAAAGTVVKGIARTFEALSTAEEIPTVATESETAVLTLTGPLNFSVLVAGGIGGTFATETTVAGVVVAGA